MKPESDQQKLTLDLVLNIKNEAKQSFGYSLMIILAIFALAEVVYLLFTA